MKKLIVSRLAILLCAFCLFGVMTVCHAEQGGYVLMNIPYDQFYAAEVTDASSIDAVASATLMKPRAMGLAGGSYHVDPDGSDITGVIFPVYVEDLSVLPSLGGKEITDESSVEITVTNKGQESTTTFTGSDALFEAPSFSWYALTETPNVYKKLNADGSFSAVSGETVTLDGSAEIIYDRHADVVIKVAGADEALADKNVSGVMLVLDDGTKVGLRHIANLWRKTEIGFALDSDVCAAVKGKTIAGIAYITLDGVYNLSVNLAVPADETLLKFTGTYIELFPEFAKEDYKDYWMECIKAYVEDDATAEMYYTMLTATYMGTLKGQEAVDAYADNPDSMLFDCFFENGVAKFVISGDVISGLDEEGKEIFSHVYHFTEDLPVTFFGQPTGTSLHIYQADDADAGAFTYFAFADDTLKETYHIEFRYGVHLEDLGNYSEGEYAYWLAAGINDGYKDSQIKACIKLFVDENVGGQEEQEAASAIEIATAEDLAAINNNLSGNYVLTADIDLAGMAWTPIGAFVMGGGEEGEVPDMAAAFTGTFDGRGHTLRNLTVNQPEGWALGLFGCAANAQIGNFILENAAVDGSVMAADAVGYAYCSTIHDVTLSGGRVNAHYTEMSAEGMYGGIAGACLGSLITGCDVQADITIPDGTANAGVVGGGLQMTSVVDCKATGSVTAGNNCYGIGGVSGCGFTSEEFTNLTAQDIVLNVGDNCFWIGGITGYAGGYPVEELGIPVTVFTNCVVRNVTVKAGDNTDGVGNIVGSGFYSEELAANGAPFDQPTQFELVDCTVENWQPI
ncbi:MAG: hypothetical protein IK099_12000 [Clostridia bacterium]|nr:hypothetical protein [Clostridia bacterium]